ncbi:Ubiquitin-conjugating enzyme family protein [Aphelenchoides avenae]|nr:Ubiquitin-conjugating enzyme family protein [Aphelenchus avenae]
MLNLQNRLKGKDPNREYIGTRVAIRDKLLAQELPELERRLREMPSCKLHFPTPTQLQNMELTVKPQSGLYKGGTFKFTITVPPEYNNSPPAVKCETRVWHPNITEEGKICLSILRENALDGYGWNPTRRMVDVVHGLDCLFTDLVNFDDPLNIEAANQHTRDRAAFEAKVRQYIQSYCR